MKTKKLFLTYNSPDDSVILWDKQEKEVLSSWATDIPISDILKDIERDYRADDKTFKIYLTLSFDILKDLNQEARFVMTKKDIYQEITNQIISDLEKGLPV